MTGQGTGIEFELSNARPTLAAPAGGRLIAHVVVNIEYWRYDGPMPRAILPAPHGVPSVPDVPNFGWAEYGLRCGLPRILRLTRELGIPVSARHSRHHPPVRPLKNQRKLAVKRSVFDGSERF